MACLSKQDLSSDGRRARLRINGGVESVPVRVLAILILAVDVLLVVVQLALKDEFPVFVEELIEVLSLLFSAFFCGEVSLRIVGQGLAAMCSSYICSQPL
jgi:hypothetical protein